VTGAAGFLGQHLVARLKQMRRRVAATDLHASGDIIPLDLLDKAGVDEAFKKTAPETVVHLAAQVGNERSLEQPYGFYANNLLGTLNVCDAAARYGVKKIVYLSSAAVYGNVGHEDLPITEETTTNPIAPYAAGKLCEEIIVKEYTSRGNMMPVILRPTIIYGPEQKEMNTIQKFIDSAIRGVPIELYGDGSHMREFIFVEDAFDAVMAAIDANELGFDKFIMSTGEPIRLSDLARMISEKVVGASVRYVDAPRPILSQRYDISRAQMCLKWRPRVSLEDGLAQTIEWRKKILLSQR
jgi:nucleoside-diphosphate-sugar epimerase